MQWRMLMEVALIGFIGQENREVDDTGFIETKTVSSKRKGRSGKPNPNPRTGLRRRKLQKPVYVFVETIKDEEVYKDYFNPDPEVEKRLLGLSDLVWPPTCSFVLIANSTRGQKPERRSRKKKNEENKEHAAEA